MRRGRKAEPGRGGAPDGGRGVLPEPVERDLVSELSLRVLSQVAPHEVPLFKATSAAHFARAEGSRGKGPKDEMLGFGLDMAMLTPAVLAVVTPVVHFVVAEVAETAKEEALHSVGHFVRRLLRRGKTAEGEGSPERPDTSPPDDPAPALSPEQVRRARDLAWERALQLGIPGETASLLADSIAGSLVTA